MGTIFIQYLCKLNSFIGSFTNQGFVARRKMVNLKILKFYFARDPSEKNHFPKSDGLKGIAKFQSLYISPLSFLKNPTLSLSRLTKTDHRRRSDHHIDR